MFVKEKELQVINGYLKPKLKDEGFKTTEKTWWKDKRDFYGKFDFWGDQLRRQLSELNNK